MSLAVRCTLSACTLLLGGSVLAAPLLSSQQHHSLSSVCAGTSSPMTATSAQTGVLLFDTAGVVPQEHDSLPASVRAAAFSNTGLVLCRSQTEVQLEFCNYILFSIPRVRIDHVLSLRAVRNPQILLATARLNGSTPAT